MLLAEQQLAATVSRASDGAAGPVDVSANASNSKGPLSGCRVVVTRAVEDSAELVAVLRRYGAYVLTCPAITVLPVADSTPMRQALDTVTPNDWVVFASRHAVAAACATTGRRLTQRTLETCRLAAIGPATSAALAAAGLNVAFTSPLADGASLARTLPAPPGTRVVLLRSHIGLPTIADALRERGLAVTDVVAYRVVDGVDRRRIPRGGRGPLAVTFTSPSCARHFITAVRATPKAGWTDPPSGTGIVCIGATTAGTVSSNGWPVHAIADEPSAIALANAVLRWRLSAAYAEPFPARRAPIGGDRAMETTR